MINKYFAFTMIFCLFTIISCSDGDSAQTTTSEVVQKEEINSLVTEMENTFSQVEIQTRITITKTNCVLTSVKRAAYNLKSDKIGSKITFQKVISNSTSGKECAGELNEDSYVRVVTNLSASESNTCIKSANKIGENYLITDCFDQKATYNRNAKTLTFDQAAEGFSAQVVVIQKNHSFGTLKSDLSKINIQYATYNKNDDSFTITRETQASNAIDILSLRF